MMMTVTATTSVSPARTRLQFTEVMRRWGWSENDLKDAIINEQVTPSIFIKDVLWPMKIDNNGKRTRSPSAVHVTKWMRVVGVRKTAPFDCEFDFLANEEDCLEKKDLVFKRDGNGYVNNRAKLSEVIQHGTLTMEEINRFELSSGLITGSPAASENANGKKTWWNTDYKVIEMASEKQADWIEKDHNINQTGSRAGKASLTAIGEAVSADIEKQEKAKSSKRTISGKTIVNYLKNNDWD